MNPSDKNTLVTAVKRWGRFALVTYALFSIVYYVSRVYFSAPFRPQSDFETPVFIGLSVMIGGLYAAALALRTPRKRESEPEPAQL